MDVTFSPGHFKMSENDTVIGIPLGIVVLVLTLIFIVSLKNLITVVL